MPLSLHGSCGSDRPSIFSFFISSSLILTWLLIAEADTDASDENALLAFSAALISPSSAQLQWSGSDPCGSKWTGITCDNSSPQRVISIVLTGWSLAGMLPSDISGLASLQTLHLSVNNFSGSLPSQLGMLTSLSFLDLQSNSFSGSIPPELGQVSKLTYLALNNNQLRGSIPHELGLLSKLYWLDLSFNLLQGPLPYSSDGNNQVNAGLDNLTSAAHFHLNNNYLSGSIPSSMCHSGMSLIHLILDSNNLTGIIPEELGNCSDLQILKLSNNNLHGSIPLGLIKLTQLNQLQLAENQLSGPLPDLSVLSALTLLDLGNNSFDDAFPAWLPLLTSLTDLDMQQTSLSGSIPGKLFGLQMLSTVRLDNNHINGTLDLTEANGFLQLVSLQNNGITALSQGQYKSVLMLEGNPVCEGSTTLSASVCTTEASIQVTYNNNTCSVSISCTLPQLINPLYCSCAIPYQGVLIFRSPSFTTLNETLLMTITTAMAQLLSVNPKQITVPSTSFNAQYQLFITVQIFPVSVSWNSDSIATMTNLLLHNLSLPVSFGPPPTFQGNPYPGEPGTSSSGLSVGAKIGIAVGVVIAVLIIAAVCFFAFFQKRRADKAMELSKPFASWGGSGTDNGGAPQVKGARPFSFAEMRKVTDNFSETNEIGSGGYGKVYKGVLATGEHVAIKRAERGSVQGANEFKTEIELLSRVHHKNVVGLVGFCYEQNEQMLVYEYMQNGTLRQNLLSPIGEGLDWNRRLMIALGAARGIMYLHELVSPPIIHRDIKSTNILLDEKRIAKVADFGLSKIVTESDSGKQHVSTQVKGTLGYLDPEYYTSQQLTEKSDVYSYGVVLLELLTARAPIERGKYVVKEVREAIEYGGLFSLRPMLDPRIRDKPLPELNAFVNLAMSCVEESASNRPTMLQVLKQLDELIGQEVPEQFSSIKAGFGKQAFCTSDTESLPQKSGDLSYPSFPNIGSHNPQLYEPR